MHLGIARAAGNPGGLTVSLRATEVLYVGDQVVVDPGLTTRKANVGDPLGTQKFTVVGGKRTRYTCCDQASDTGQLAANIGEIALVCVFGLAFLGTNPLTSAIAVVPPAVGAIDAYTKAQSDARYEPIDTMYTKAESDARYEPIDSMYTKAESDARYAPIAGVAGTWTVGAKLSFAGEAGPTVDNSYVRLWGGNVSGAFVFLTGTGYAAGSRGIAFLTAGNPGAPAGDDGTVQIQTTGGTTKMDRAAAWTFPQGIAVGGGMTVAGAASFSAAVQHNSQRLYYDAAGDTYVQETAPNQVDFVAGGGNALRLDNVAATNRDTRMWVSLGGGVGLIRVTIGANDSGGVGTACLRVPNM